MKNHIEMFEALLAGETLIGAGRYRRSLDVKGNLFTNDSVQDSFMEIPPSEWEILRKTININGFEVPVPVDRPLAEGDQYCIPSFETGYRVATWHSSEVDFRRLSLGLIHLQSSSAILHSRALVSFASASSL